MVGCLQSQILDMNGSGTPWHLYAERKTIIRPMKEKTRGRYRSYNLYLWLYFKTIQLVFVENSRVVCGVVKMNSFAITA